VKELREQFGDEKDHFFANFNKEQCGKYLQYKKKGKEDGKMPEDLAGRVARCILWMDRPSPTASFDDDDDILPTLMLKPKMIIPTNLRRMTMPESCLV